MKIRTKLVLSFGAVVLAMLLTLGAITYVTFAEGIFVDHTELFRLRARESADRIQTVLEQEVEDLRLALSAAGPKDAKGAWDRERLLAAARGSRYLRVVLVAAEDGRVLASADERAPADLARQLASATRGRDEKKGIVVPVGDALYLVCQLYEPAGPHLAGDLLVARLDALALQSTLLQNNMPGAMLIAASGRQPLLTVFPADTSSLADLDVRLLVATALERRGGVVQRPGIFLHGAVSAPLGLSLVYAVPKQTFLRDLETYKNRVVTALVLVGWATLWVVLIIARRLAQPILRLSQASQDLISFSYGEPLEFAPSNDEIGTLAKNFETMRLRIKELIFRDPLTGLYNRRHLMHELETLAAKAQRMGEELFFLMIDADHFKIINDTHGHSAGDEVLAALGKLLQEQVRTYDVVARYGGEEFAVVLPDTTLDGARAAAERIRESTAAMEIVCKGRAIRVTVSQGLAAFSALTVKTPDALIDAADSALYEAKNSGRNRTAEYRGGPAS